MENFVIKGYSIQQFLSKTPCMNVYRGASPDGAVVMVAEYFAEEICSRGENHQILVRQDVVMQYKEQVFQFVEKARKLEQMNEEGLPKPIDVFYEKGTAFVIWPVHEGIGWPAYIITHGKGMTPLHRLGKFLPLMQALDRCAAQGMFFMMQPQDILVGDWGRLFLNSFFQVGLPFGESLCATREMLYLAVAGMPYPAQGGATNELYEAYEAMRSGRLIVHNFDALYRIFEQGLKGVAVVKPEPPASKQPFTHVPLSAEPHSNPGAPPVAPLFAGEKQDRVPHPGVQTPRKPQTGYAVMVAMSAIVVVLILIMVAAYASQKEEANVSARPTLDIPAMLEQIEAQPTDANGDGWIDGDTNPDDLLHGISVYLRGDRRVVFNQAVVSYEAGILYRQWDEGWHLMKDDGESQIVLADGVFPKFMTVANGYVYYSDSFDEHHVYRVSLNGGEPELMLSHPAASFAIDDDTIYYSNLEYNAYLYESHIPSIGNGGALMEESAYDLYIDAENRYLYYTDDAYQIYRMDLETKESTLLADGVNYAIRFDGDTLYAMQDPADDENFMDSEGRSNEMRANVYAYAPDGKRTEVMSGVQSYRYNVSGDYLYYVDHETEQMNRQNIKTGEHSQIVSDVDVYWLAAHEADTLYWYSALKNENGTLKKWSKEKGEETVDVGLGNFDYEPMDESYIQSLDEEAMYGTNLSSMIYGSPIVKDEEGNWYFMDFYEARGGNGVYSIYHALYRRTPQGKTKAIFSSIGSDMVYDQGNIYYSDDDGGVKAFDIQAEKERTLASMNAEKIFAYQDRLYVRDDEKNIWVMDFDGENQEKIVTNHVGKFFVYGDKIYFIHTSDSNRLYACDLDGMNKNPLIDMEGIKQISASNGKLYFAAEADASSGRMFCSDLDGTNIKEIAPYDVGESMYVYKEWIYLTNPSALRTSVRRIRIDGSVSMPVVEPYRGYSTFAVVDNHLFIKKEEEGEMDSFAYICDMDGKNPVRLNQE